jgi:hypothetical protein
MLESRTQPEDERFGGLYGALAEVNQTTVWDGHLERLFGFGPGAFDGMYAGLEHSIYRDHLPFVACGEYSPGESGQPSRVHGGGCE